MPAGFSEERLARIPRFLQGQVDAGTLPGALTLIWRRGGLAHVSMVGQMDMGRGVPMRRDGIFRLYSMTKPVTAVALLMLMEQGLIALDDPVARFIPEFADLKLQGGAAPKRAMTVQDLLRHTAGFTYGFHNRTPDRRRLSAPAHRRVRHRRRPCRHDRAIENIAAGIFAGRCLDLFGGHRCGGLSGRTGLAANPLPTFVREKILSPLKMTRYRFSGRHGKARPFRGLLCAQGWQAGPVRRSAKFSLVRRSQAGIGRRRAGGHRRRLFALLPDAAEPRRIGRRAPAVAENRRADDRQQLARRPRKSPTCRRSPMLSTKAAIAASASAWGWR